MRPARRFVLGLLSFVLLMACTATSAWADLGQDPGSGSGGGGGGGGGGGTSNSGGSGGGGAASQSSDGDDAPVYGHKKSCSLYANSSSFGLACVGGDGHAPHVRDLIGDEPVPICWETEVSPHDAHQKYGQDVPTVRNFDYWLRSCIFGATKDTLLLNLNLSTQLIFIKQGTPACPQPGGKGYSLPELTGDGCILKLIGAQTRIQGYLDDIAHHADIPSVTLASLPNPLDRVRTQVDNVYYDASPCDGCSHDDTQTASENAGGVSMYAQLDSYKILPKGPAADNPNDGEDAVGPCNRRQKDPQAADACDYTYTHSSRSYPLRAVATWSVYVDGERFAGPFHKYADFKLPVGDVQTLVIPGRN